MIPYVIVYIIIFLLSFKIRKNKFTIFDVLALLTLIFFSATRYGIGTDYKLYSTIYQRATDIQTLGTSRTGIGFSYLLLFFKNCLSLDYQYLIAFCSIVTISAFYYFIKKNSENPGRALLIYLAIGLYASSFNGFRQNMSISLALVGLTLLKENKKVFSIIFLMISVLFHNSSIALIILYYIIVIKKIEIKPKYILIISIILFLSYSILFPKIIGILNSYSDYIQTDFSSVPGLGTYLMVMVYYVIYFILLSPKQKYFNETERKYISLFSITICIMSLQLHNWLFNRISDIFIVFMPIILSKYYDLISNKNKKTFSFIFHVCCFIYYLVYIYSFGEVNPYQNILW